MNFPLVRVASLWIIAAGIVLIDTYSIRTDRSDVVCPSDPGNPSDNATLLPNPKNCSTFFYCDHGIPVEMACPKNTYFNPALLVCDDKNNVQCLIDNLLPDLILCNETDGLVILPNPYDCSSYVVCDPSNWGLGFLQYCPDGLKFNPDLGVCDYPDNFECIEEIP